MNRLSTKPVPNVVRYSGKKKGRVRYLIIDPKDACLQIPLDDSSSDVTTISTHIGFFRYRRLPFVVSSAPAIFQNFMDRVLHGISSTTCYIDDIIVTGKTDSEHLENLRRPR
ncbi:Retrovirus-related Pol polyprotein from transposon 17.6 [Thelohanellus kitauei]|uniref:Retrovirus-related Pol polyprotein from transposon 17.6 n=1 Tax=Thelohanellus kitauei TaxID=669202 RepID=A0A0C2J4C7_THEKT|nr:Retrovirus-related Pol polyprotein from transposon 17.6 [Thelohanellus kitauei]